MFLYPEEKQSASDSEPHVLLMTHDEAGISKCLGSKTSKLKTQLSLKHFHQKRTDLTYVVEYRVLVLVNGEI